MKHHSLKFALVAATGWPASGPLFTESSTSQEEINLLEPVARTCRDWLADESPGRGKPPVPGRRLGLCGGVIRHLFNGTTTRFDRVSTTGNQIDVSAYDKF